MPSNIYKYAGDIKNPGCGKRQGAGGFALLEIFDTSTNPIPTEGYDTFRMAPTCSVLRLRLLVCGLHHRTKQQNCRLFRATFIYGFTSLRDFRVN